MLNKSSLPALKPLAAVIALASTQQAWAACSTEATISNVTQYDSAVVELENSECAGETITWTLQPGAIINNPSRAAVQGLHLVVNGSVSSPALINSGSGFSVNGAANLSINNAIFDGSGSIYGENQISIDNVTFRNFDSRAITIDESNGGLEIRNSQFINIHSTSDGGAINATYAGDVLISNSSFIGNSSWDGGALYINGTNSLVIEDSLFENNTAEQTYANDFDGGGAASIYSSLVLRNSTFRNNTATGKGGALIVGTLGSLEITDSIFEGNSVTAPDGDEDTATPNGGGIWMNDGVEVTIDNTRFEDNHAGYNGGALSVAGTTYNPSETKQITITDSQFIENSAAYSGGAIHSEGKYITVGESGYYTTGATIANTEFSSNTAKYYGGAVCAKNMDRFDVDYSLYANNIANEDSAGAIYFAGGKNTVIRNSTFDGNQGAKNASTLSWSNISGSNSFIEHSTFTNNQIVPAPAAEDKAGALYFGVIPSGNFEISHSIFSGNNFGQSVIFNNSSSFAKIALNYSLLDDQTNTSAAAYVLDGTNLLGGDGLAVLDAELHPLADNGGPTLTRYPMDDSPVIDAGNEFIGDAPEDDQRGSARIIDTIDIGAVEYKNLPPEIIRSTWTVETGTEFTFDFADYISDPDNHLITFTVTEKPTWLTFTGDGSTASGTVGDVGSYSLTVSVDDGNGFELDVTILITVTSEPLVSPEPEPETTPETESSNKKKAGSFGFAIAMLTGGLLLSRRTHRKEA